MRESLEALKKAAEKGLQYRTIRLDEGRNDMVGTQTVIDPETGEIMDIDTIKELYTETSISGKKTIKERMKLGEMVRVEMVGQVVTTGEALDDNGIKYHVQKIKVFSIGEIKRGAL